MLIFDFFVSLFSQKNVICKRHVCDVKNSRPEYDLATSVNDRVILSF